MYVRVRKIFCKYSVSSVRERETSIREMQISGNGRAYRVLRRDITFYIDVSYRESVARKFTAPGVLSYPARRNANYIHIDRHGVFRYAYHYGDNYCAPWRMSRVTSVRARCDVILSFFFSPREKPAANDRSRASAWRERPRRSVYTRRQN